MKLNRIERTRAGSLRASEVVDAALSESPKFNFDPREDLPDEIYSKSMEILYLRRKPYYEDHFYNIAVPMAVIHPETRSEFNINEDDRRILLRHIQNSQGQLANMYARDLLMSMHDYVILFPDQRDDVALDDEKWETLLKQLQDFFGDWRDYVYKASKMLVIHPERRGDVVLNEEVWTGALQELEVRRSSRDKKIFCEMAANLVLLFPERKKEIYIDKEEKDQMLKRYDDDNARYDRMVLNMAIIAADQVSVDRRGIHFENDSDLIDAIELPGRLIA